MRGRLRWREEKGIEMEEVETGERECVKREKIIKYNFSVLVVMFNRNATSTTFLQLFHNKT